MSTLSCNGKSLFSRPTFRCHTPVTVRCSVLHSEGGGGLDFGGQDLPEPPLQLLHVGRFGPGQVEAASSFLTVHSSQRSEHLKHRQRPNRPGLNATGRGSFNAASTCFATWGQQNKLQTLKYWPDFIKKNIQNFYRLDLKRRHFFNI